MLERLRREGDAAYAPTRRPRAVGAAGPFAAGPFAETAARAVGAAVW